MPSRRKFISNAALGSFAAVSGIGASCQTAEPESTGGSHAVPTKTEYPVVVSTWNFGIEANEEAMSVLSQNGSALDAVERGVRLIEADPANSSVGYGGLPDREGNVTLDACIMGPDGRCGSVCALEGIMHPVSVARLVMEKTPHVILVGKGAQELALEHGIETQNLLTAEAKAKWEAWKVEAKYKPIINVENHDTIGMLAIDKKGDIAGACTTSGLAFKMRGRVGDSPIIGAGLFIDNNVGGATATGLGEAVLRTCGSFLAVELMRQGMSPSEACRTVVERIVNLHPEYKDFQIGLIAVNKMGETGGYCIHEGFSYAKSSLDGGEEIKPDFFMKNKE